MTARHWFAAGVASLAACVPRPAPASPQTCAPTVATLPPGASGASLEGQYRIRLVATAGPRRGGTADGTLSLGQPAPAPAAGPRRHVLAGHGELPLENVGAPPARLESEDPMRPGVLVFDLAPRADGSPSGPRVLLRLGDEANRQDVMRIEGTYTVLRVREMREDGFAGEWSSGDPAPVAEGFFCAWRAGGAN